MSEPDRSRRPNRREIAAAATREEVLRAARRLFAANGYAPTTLNQIAEEAGVAIQTVYSSVGGKPALVLALNDLIDAESGVGPLAAEIARTDDAEVVFVNSVKLTRQLNERCSDILRVLLAAAPSNPDVAAAVRDGMARHRGGAELFGHRLAELDALGPGVSAEQATTAYAVMTSPDNWRQLTQDFGWSYDKAEAWLVDSLTRLLRRP